MLGLQLLRRLLLLLLRFYSRGSCELRLLILRHSLLGHLLLELLRLWTKPSKTRSGKVWLQLRRLLCLLLLREGVVLESRRLRRKTIGLLLHHSSLRGHLHLRLLELRHRLLVLLDGFKEVNEIWRWPLVLLYRLRFRAKHIILFDVVQLAGSVESALLSVVLRKVLSAIDFKVIVVKILFQGRC